MQCTCQEPTALPPALKRGAPAEARPSPTVKDIKGWLGSRADKTKALQHTGIYRLHLEATATLDTEEVRLSVALPEGVGEDEWIASQVLSVFEEVSLVMSLIDDMCTEETCPLMRAGKDYSYSWADERNPVPVELSAPAYTRKLVEFAWEKLTDPELVPTDGRPFPQHFRSEMQMLLKRFFRVYAHTYIHHFQDVRDCGAEAHLNLFLKHFLAFVGEFKLVSKEDMRPLRDLIKSWSLGQKGGSPAAKSQPAQGQASPDLR